ncbi:MULTISPECIES: 4-hydroxy-3-methylbut-2-enyl diphosphate reductase [unclassified Brevundimonas]|jgi:4-hydroxy-3-methylbut-2-enyl diphosphate reductase|uniref:4-hydroxy-3-methylbut-2-enyl diphosphate reductase n=1 Tax=unclassified Brevundimonas TaxID=2622653 RepID=UPI000CFCA978|nr:MULTISPECIES: 4-hydroxy-3-methylbut-2-enyl diphosphate reductase [unclassified Brevundimonas]PRA30432.1 4-hydroxy-3-methylbut-2-enyl diphosphate reductase [Brevundimonas sp. MYb27]PQZ83289.1 4-hydroxy-3-methylbut-2-enyl diphosphate reductase [Brevundimonas sp. MYb31]PRB16177.1 4-hydroxy-3-methylbut-2-enyl diphosphate reductase [Brevundimonas sp. MYb52]PRB35211.1 4-hydroxy-3-methylbut-2-enyl diphosphate reductase [Brevundimonas sp. MYb46]PRB46107.1 4-hydroxy-3-methylbut-2-enyl diphosphate re
MNAPLSPSSFDRRPLNVRLATPRGFCAGVDRAIQIVERAIEKFGAPVYVRHEIVHNRHVVERLKGMGAVFVKELDECPDDRPVVFSAHGVPKSVPATARSREMLFLDATCPLVSKVHVEAERHHAAGRHIVLIGHAGHPEVVGTMGQLPPGSISLVETVADAEAFQRPGDQPLAYATQTTLSVDDTADILAALKRRFPELPDPHKEDICYATTNRQEAVKRLGEGCQLVLVVGSKNSSNSARLVDVALKAGASDARLVDDASDVDWTWFDGVTTVGVTAGASAPEPLIEALIDAIRARFDAIVTEDDGARETVSFKLPRVLTA